MHLDDKILTLPNAPAYPTDIHRGLTKRELFAALAMQGLMANTHTNNQNVFSVIESSVAAADLLITELNIIRNKANG